MKKNMFFFNYKQLITLIFTLRHYQYIEPKNSNKMRCFRAVVILAAPRVNVIMMIGELSVHYKTVTTTNPIYLGGSRYLFSIIFPDF